MKLCRITRNCSSDPWNPYRRKWSTLIKLKLTGLRQQNTSGARPDTQRGRLGSSLGSFSIFHKKKRRPGSLHWGRSLKKQLSIINILITLNTNSNNISVLNNYLTNDIKSPLMLNAGIEYWKLSLESVVYSNKSSLSIQCHDWMKWIVGGLRMLFLIYDLWVLFIKDKKEYLSIMSISLPVNVNYTLSSSFLFVRLWCSIATSLKSAKFRVQAVGLV